jgi:predicted nicotinamide N-methyase
MDQDQFTEDERIPYWVDLWPASIVLAEWLYSNRRRLHKAFCLDIGCGLGLTSLGLDKYASRVLALDYEFEALQYAQHNAFINHLPSPSLVQMDWRNPGFQNNIFSFIWGADIVYEKRFFPPLIELFDVALAPEGIIWLTSPNRQVDTSFWQLLGRRGWQTLVRQTLTKSCPQGMSTKIFLWEITRHTSS